MSTRKPEIDWNDLWGRVTGADPHLIHRSGLHLPGRPLPPAAVAISLVATAVTSRREAVS